MKSIHSVIRKIFIGICLLLLCMTNVHAYIDPTIVTYTIQIVAGIMVGAGFLISVYFRKITQFINRHFHIQLGKRKIKETEDLKYYDPETGKEIHSIHKDDEVPQHSSSLFPSICATGIVISFLFCVFSPLEYYFHNTGDIHFSLSSFIPYILLNFILCSVLIILILCVLDKINEKICHTVILILLIGYFWFYIQGTFFIKDLPPLDGTYIDWGSYSKQNIQSIFIVCILIIIAGILIYKNGIKKTTGYMNVLSLFITCVLTVTLVYLGVHNTSETTDRNAVVTDEYLFNMSEDKNYIILVADAVDSATFKNLMETSDPQFRDILEDFTYYPDTVCAYPYTTVSIPFILSGEWFLNEKPFQEYVNDALDHSELFQMMKENDYTMDFYDDSLQYKSDGILRFENVKEESYSFKSFKDYLNAEGKLSWFKYAPYPLKKYVHVPQEIFLDIQKTEEQDHIYSWKNHIFIDQIKNVNIDYTKKRCFKYIHIQGAHRPFEYNSNAELIDMEKGTYEQNVEAAFYTINSYLQKLKDADVYDNSVIIILADHGFENPQDLPEVARGNAFLAIKGWNEHHTLEISDIPVSYEDLQEAYQDLFDGKNSEDLFQKNIGLDRQRRFILYSYQDEEHMYEYRQYGHASDYRLMVNTGETYFYGEDEK